MDDPVYPADTVSDVWWSGGSLGEVVLSILLQGFLVFLSAYPEFDI